MMHDDMSSPKLQSLMDLISEMKRLQASSLHGDEEGPHGMEVEIHAQKLDPQDLEKMEEATHQDLDNDNEEGESPEHKAMVLGDHSDMDEESPEEDQDEDEDMEDHSEMQLPPGLMKLLMEKMGK